MDQRCTSVWLNAKLKEKACRDDVDIDKWIWVEGLSVFEKSGLITWRVSKKIKIRDDKWKAYQWVSIRTEQRSEPTKVICNHTYQNP